LFIDPLHASRPIDARVLQNERLYASALEVLARSAPVLRQLCARAGQMDNKPYGVYLLAITRGWVRAVALKQWLLLLTLCCAGAGPEDQREACDSAAGAAIARHARWLRLHSPRASAHAQHKLFLHALAVALGGPLPDAQFTPLLAEYLELCAGAVGWRPEQRASCADERRRVQAAVPVAASGEQNGATGSPCSIAPRLMSVRRARRLVDGRAAARGRA
jgi:hypothetical protein